MKILEGNEREANHLIQVEAEVVVGRKSIQIAAQMVVLKVNNRQLSRRAMTTPREMKRGVAVKMRTNQKLSIAVQIHVIHSLRVIKPVKERVIR